MFTKVATKQQTLPDAARLIDIQYGCGPVQFVGTDEALYERHLLFDSGVDPAGGNGARPLRGAGPVSARHSISAYLSDGC